MMCPIKKCKNPGNLSIDAHYYLKYIDLLILVTTSIIASLLSGAFLHSFSNKSPSNTPKLENNNEPNQSERSML